MKNSKFIYSSLIIAFILSISLISAGVTRDFSSSNVSENSLVNITLNIQLNGATYYSIEENIPSGYTIINNGGADASQTGRLKWLVIQNAQNTSYTYTLRAPSINGTYAFSGTYMFEGDTHEKLIGGKTSIVIGATNTTTQNNTNSTGNTGNSDTNNNQNVIINNIIVNNIPNNPSNSESKNNSIQLYAENLKNSLARINLKQGLLIGSLIVLIIILVILMIVLKKVSAKKNSKKE